MAASVPGRVMARYRSYLYRAQPRPGTDVGHLYRRVAEPGTNVHSRVLCAAAPFRPGTDDDICTGGKNTRYKCQIRPGTDTCFSSSGIIRI